MMRFLITALLALVCFPAAGQLHPCDDPSLPKELAWNPPKADTTERLAQFYRMNDTLSKAVGSKDFELAASTARKFLEESRYYRCNWNFGNAIHDAHAALGMEALHRGDVSAAASFLVQAGRSPGSPQLDTFGPDLDLAKAVLNAGRKDAVAAYLWGIGRFWKEDDGLVERWKLDLSAGRTPDFDSD
ncbi:hypothetical protein [Tahibacter harae]|uniref:Sel1 repeat family protein n=1 Tax=Tahibacter harae TaxID=2963937 RepID=A0ABT1QR10_9GAMM|nr:hypothetical protein [Tahibacter harae]MCQ4164709.1 hypothetical protein [Tahibacter harae]